MASNAEATAPEPRLDRRTRLILTISRVWAWVFLAGLVAFFWISVTYTTDGEVNFLSLRNIMNVLVAITPILLMGLGQTFVIISGGIDLSVGWVMGLSSVVSAYVARDLSAAGVGEAPAIVVAFALGILTAMFIGFITGVVVA